MNILLKGIATVALAGMVCSGIAMAQAPAGQAPAAPGAPPQGGPGGGGGGGGRGQQAPLASPNPIYSSVKLEIDVNKPVADVWARVGKYCDIGEWLQANCTITSSKNGEVGEVRSIGAEIMVAKTQYSYTYTQPVRVGAFYNMYHGTLEARAVTPTTSKLIYTLVWDNSNLADDAAREADKTQRANTFNRAMQNMKTLAEGGTLPARGGGGGGRGGPGGPGGGGPGGGGGQRQ
jgi:hypothetical protein